MNPNLEPEADAQRLLDVYAALAACDSVIIRSNKREDLFQEICLHLVQDGAASFAWIGLTDAGSTDAWPQAQHGGGWSAAEFMQLIEKVHTLPRTGPVDVAIRENRPVWADVLADEPSLHDRLALLQDKGWNSAAVLPLTIGGQVRGALSIYATVPNWFCNKVRGLLVQLASNISHALDYFELEARRKQAEFELHESEARYSALFSNNSMPMLVVNPVDGLIVDANIKAVNFYGWERAALLGKSLRDIYAQSEDQIRKEMAQAVQSGHAYFNARHRLANADVRDVEVFSNPISIGGNVYMVSAIHDVTERRSLEARVQTSKSILQRFIDQLPGTVFVKDEQLRLVLANKQLARQLNTEPQDLIGKSAQEFFPPDFARVVEEIDRQMFAAGGSRSFDESFAGRHIETNMFVMENGVGQRLLGGISFDVTERYHARERAVALLHINDIGSRLPEREFLSKGLEEAERLTHSRIGFLHFVNEDQETLELVTWTSSALKGCTAGYDNHYPVSQAGIWADCLRNRAPVVFNDYAACTAKKGLPEGHAPLQRLISVPIIENGKVRMMLGVGNKESLYDDSDVETLLLIGNDLWRIARRARAEADLKQRVTELTESNQKLADVQVQLLQSEKMASIGQLAAGVAHEINNPIGFVKSNLGTLKTYVDNLVSVVAAYEHAEKQSGPSTAAAFEAVQAIKKDLDYDFLLEDLTQLLSESRDGVERVSKIVQDLKNFSRSGETAKEWCDLQAGIESTINVVWNQLKYKVQLTREYAVLPALHCIPSQINQVVMNLLTNAEQSISEKGHITVRTGVQGDEVWFEVQDDGCGISPENQAKIFEPFYTSKPVGKGTGLGLSISMGIVLRHGGRISVQSNAGQGSTFRVTLPIEMKTENTKTEAAQ